MHFDHVIFQTLFALLTGVFFFLGITLIVRKLPLAYKILGINFIVMGVGVATFYMMFTGLFHAYPHFTKVNSPFVYLWGPLYFLFVTYLIYPNTVWKRWYWLFFVPAGLHLVEMIPYFLVSIEEKLLFVNRYIDGNAIEAPNGVLTSRMHVILKSALVLVFCIAVYYQLRPVVWNRQHLLFEKNSLLINWVLTGLGLKFICFLTIFIIYVFTRYMPIQIIRMSYFLGFVDSLFYALYLLIHPSLLLGIQWTDIKLIESYQDETLDTTTPSRPKVVQEEEQVPHEPENPSSPVPSKWLLLMDQYMQVEQPYLNSNLTIEDVADKLRIKPYKLSHEIKACYGISFSDLVNSYRLNFIDEKIRADEQWKSYSIETMALRAGFGSRAAFYVAFRKLRKEQPKAYYGLK